MSELDQTVLRFSLKGLQKRPSFMEKTQKLLPKYKTYSLGNLNETKAKLFVISISRYREKKSSLKTGKAVYEKNGRSCDWKKASKKQSAASSII